jgi:hypothetical protein
VWDKHGTGHDRKAGGRCTALDRAIRSMTAKRSTPGDRENVSTESEKSVDEYHAADWKHTGDGWAHARFEHWGGQIREEQSHVVIHETYKPGEVSFEVTHGVLSGEPALGASISLAPDDAEAVAYDLLAMAKYAREMKEREADE